MAAKTITLAVVVSSWVLLAQLLLLQAPATTATTVPLSAAGDADVPVPVPPFFFPAGGSGAAAARCWNAVLRAESCAGDILSSLLSILLHDGARPRGDVSAACCGVLQAVGARCFHDLQFTDSPFRPLYGPLVSHVCGFPASSGVIPDHRE
ncbi:hypothetical protein GUJ93_ZPchr0010g7340 [Zizania palustris]|uniref:Prolamin-like domain-containing protein n=1 Tax=Zizania palustris TaxID=103762 RepID=A0A8J5WB59_ZIZPA|nr:hypothetical protein GUJ93_ZPchr0010g7340 [Zizania palustris]